MRPGNELTFLDTPASNETAQGDDELTLAPLAAAVSAAVY
jgi:hypothetical protein